MRGRGPALRLGLALALAVAIVGGACSDDDDGPVGSGRGGGCVNDREMDVYSEGGVVHTDAPGYGGPLGSPTPTYRVNPPSGGDHLSQAAPPGVYAGLNVIPDGVLVHTLEHGYVILWYRPDLPVDQITTLRDVRDKYARDALVVEREDMPVPVAATAWKQRLLCQEVDAEVLGDFIEKARNKAPEKVPH